LTICLRPQDKGREFLLNQSNTGYRFPGTNIGDRNEFRNEFNKTKNT